MLEGISMVEQNQRTVFFATKFRVIYNAYVYARKRMHVSKDILKYDYHRMTLQKNSVLKESFDIL